ncbi:Transcription factor hamlet [Porphyridium purpureum]|uniref:Transcription factor hamlet n=1 Tax=Porphyridium purpureum TaxID=35688 RepID=A0A5J4YKD8_PORPP|nr:Transcription factor hamlet [Porphyridium purpureum]|eukprot:POR4306..scf289_17
MPADSLLRVLLEEDVVNSWCVKWCEGVLAGEGLARQVAVLGGGGMGGVRSAASSDCAHSQGAQDVRQLSVGLDVRYNYDVLTPRELHCIPFLPTPRDLENALVVDSNVKQLNERTMALIVPMFETGRFVAGISYLNTSSIPLPAGVYKLPGHRFVGFRTRYGYAYLDVGICTDGTVIFRLFRMWENGRTKAEVFHVPHIEKDAPVLSYTSMERRGCCLPDCTNEASCICWRQPWHRRSDRELESLLTWKEYRARYTQSIQGIHVRHDGQVPIMNVFSGDRRLMYQFPVPLQLEVAAGNRYHDMDRLKFLFFDRLSMASSAYHSRVLTRPGSLSSHSPKAKTRNDDARNGTLAEVISFETIAPSKRARVDTTIAVTSSGASFSQPSVKSEDDGTGAGGRRAAGCSSGRSKDGKYKCTMCGNVFGRNSELRRHEKTVHLKASNHQCTKCERSFSQAVHLQTHVRAVHEKRRDFRCPVCPSSFAVSSNYKRHMRSFHPSNITTVNMNAATSTSRVAPNMSRSSAR